MGFDQDFIEQVRNSISIVDVISEKINVQKKGHNFIALCPFHNDTNPSMHISEEKQIFKCFSCQEGGDCFKFLQKYENISFPEAVRELARKANISLPDKAVVSGPSHDDSQAIKAVNEKAMHLFHKYLCKHKNADPGRAYLRKRGVKREMLRLYKIGYAPDSFDFLKIYLKQHFSVSVLKKSGLFFQSRKNGRYYDFFRNRIIFPIITERNEVVGFGGRAVGPAGAKYINTRETAVYKKNYLLYGLNRIYHKINKEKTVYITEGYLDVIACQMNNVAAVAPLGTALTSAQIIKLKRYARKMICLFDSDQAGYKAALRASELLVENGCDGEVVMLPQDTDPYDYFRYNNYQDFQDYAEAHKDDIYEFILKNYIPARELSPAKKSSVVNDFQHLLRRIKDTVVKNDFVKMAAKRLQVDKQLLLEGAVKPARAPRKKNTVSITAKIEKEFILLLCENPVFIPKALAVFSPDDIKNKTLRYIYNKLINLRQEGKVTINKILDQFSDEKIKDFITN
ncbi:MAG TPA: DNA primase, partial [Spirochaetota bacterium]|nr:DNA primase [Spirochaetota bacterium]